MFKLLFFLFLLFLFVILYSFKKRVDNVLDVLFPPKNKRKGDANNPDVLVKCLNCGVYLPKSDAVKKIKLNGEILYFCSEQCKKEYSSKK